MTKWTVQGWTVLACVCVLAAGSPSPSLSPSPAAVASLVSDAVLEFGKQGQFFEWEYGSGIIIEALLEAAEEFGYSNYTKQVNAVLDGWITSPDGIAYKVLHDVQLPWYGGPGDIVGCYPIGYVRRARLYRRHPEKAPANYSEATDIEIARRIADQYVLGWPHLLPDGTIFRTNGWPPANSSSSSSTSSSAEETILWADDHFLGLALTAELGAFLNESRYVEWSARQILTFAAAMQDPADGLYFHGVNLGVRPAVPSCCKWARANGWVAMASADILDALRAFPGNALQPEVLGAFRSHSAALAAAQTGDGDGRWHQVLNESSTYLETSASSMFALSFARGIARGWLDAQTYLPHALRAWGGLAKAVPASGQVTGICEGSIIGGDVAYYQNRPTNFFASSPGIGSVVRAAVAYSQLNAHLQATKPATPQ